MVVVVVVVVVIVVVVPVLFLPRGDEFFFSPDSLPPSFQKVLGIPGSAS